MTDNSGRLCSIDDCPKGAFGRGWCSMHYATWRKHGDPLHPVVRRMRGLTCSVDGCGKKATRRGMCDTHKRRIELYGETTEPHQRRFWAKVNKNGPIPAEQPGLGPCWIWSGYIAPKTGYGQYGGKEKGKTNLAHRIAYQLEVGPIPKGYHLDHLCRVRACCRPSHLEPVPPRENLRRGDQGVFWGYIPEQLPPRSPKPTVCTEDDCDRPVYKRTICRPHYRKWLNDPNVVRPSKMTVEQRFLAKIDKNGPVPAHRVELGPCWLWTAVVNRGTGYGHFSLRHGVMVQAHRFSYEMANGAIPSGLDVHHMCHVRRCVRPSHLRATTRSQNLAERKIRRVSSQ